MPTFYLTAEFDMERVAEMRTAMAELGDGFKVSFNDIVIKAVATALAQHPECNAHWLGDRHSPVSIASTSAWRSPSTMD